MFQCTLNKRGYPFLDDISVLLGLIAEKFKEWPEPTLNAPLQRNMLDFLESVHKAVESISAIRQGIKVMSEEELRCGIDCEASG